MFRRTRVVPILLAAACLTGSAVQAETIVIDDATAGTVYDSMLDGALVGGPPTFPVLPANGAADSQGSPLSIALNSNIEQRAAVELPLKLLAGVTAVDVVSATVTVTVDDVLGLFWPVTAMFTDNAAASTIDIYTYAGDGAVAATGQAPDFAAGTLAGTINTGAPGSITDATLLLSGPVSFQLDVTTQLQALLTGSATHLGLNLRTTDSNTGTSLDNAVGYGSGRPPFLTVVTSVEPVPGTFDTLARTCQKAIGTYARVYSNTVLTQSQTCYNRVIKDVANAKPLTAAAAACAKALDVNAALPSKVDKARSKALDKIVLKCASPLTPASVSSPCSATAATFTDVANCVLDEHFEQVQQLVRTQFADACKIATAVGLDGDYGVVCSIP